MTSIIIDYGSGNLRSVARAFEHVSKTSVTISSNASDLKQASHIVLPGVGAFGDCMNGLKALPGMLDALQEEVISKKKLFLGICVGMQMLFERGLEHGEHKGLGWLKGEVDRIGRGRPLIPLKIPHMGWNELAITRAHPLLSDIPGGAHAYFVHSYCAYGDAADVIATTGYGQTLTAVVAKGNIMGTQFHPEKSQETGLALIRNFLGM